MQTLFVPSDSSKMFSVAVDIVLFDIAVVCYVASRKLRMRNPENGDTQLLMVMLYLISVVNYWQPSTCSFLIVLIQIYVSLFSI